MNNTGQQQSNNDNNNSSNSSSNSNSNSQDHQNPGNSITNSDNMFSPSASANSNESVGAGQPFGSSDNSTAHFFQQQQQQQQQQGADIGSMDDVQFSASLDALLNGDQLSSITGSSTGHAHTSSSGGNSGSTNCGSFSTQQQQQQQAMHVAQPYLVSAGAPGTAGGYAPQQHQASTGQTQQGQQQQQQVQQLSGLPLASAHQGALQLVPQGPHSAAQMSLSAAHAAATGAFHPGNPSPMAALPQQQAVQASFPWTITSNMVAPPTATVAASPPAPMSVVTSTPTMIGNMQQVSGNSSSNEGRRGKRTHEVSAVSVDGDQSKRRSDRNQREQQRSHKITEQIAELRDILSSANLQFKPDKYSTLTKVVEYIRQLQERSQFLDVEHKKLIESISETNEIVNNQYMPAYASGSDSPSMSNDLLADGVSSSLEDESMVYVRGLDYKIAFQGCGIPLALSSIDGRFLDCNDTFLALTGYSREELLPLDEPGEKNTVSFSPNQDESSKKNLSLFNLLSRDGMEQVFSAMSEMLKHPGSIGTPETKPTDASRRADFWSGPVKLCHQDNRPVKLNVTLVRTSRGRPKFFNCALTALSADNALHFDDSTTLTAASQSLSNTPSQQQQTPEQSQVKPFPSKEEPAGVPSLNQPKMLSNGQPEVAVSNPGGG